MWSFIVKLFSKCSKKIDYTKKSRTELLSMSKKELEIHARKFGIELDRRRNKETLVKQVLEAQLHND